MPWGLRSLLWLLVAGNGPGPNGGALNSGLIVVAEAKLQAGSMRISGAKLENHFKYASKFGYGVGTGSYQLRLQLSQPRKIGQDAELQLAVYVDEEWRRAEALEDVCSRVGAAREVKDVMVRGDGQWGEWVGGSIQQNWRPDIWYFAVSSCNNALQNFTHRVRYEFRATQADSSEFSIEMQWDLGASVLCLIGFTAFFWWFGQSTFSFFKSVGSVHPVIWTLSMSLLMQYLGQVFHTLHLWRYSYNGVGFQGCDVLGEMMFMISQVTQTALMILIGLGYTLLQSNVGELDLMIPLCLMVGVIHIMLVGFGKIKGDAAYKYHENEGVIGWLLLVLRLLLYAWFLWAVQSSAKEGGTRLKAFLIQFRLAGSAYFLAYPGIFILTKSFEPYLQHGIMASGLMVMQMASNAWLASLFLTRGEYFKVSALSMSELPGGCRVGMMKEE
mmetsp:Transcript_47035/g.102357  ORF Transcript_47035/g.102357 Transcript_47035/m.102357 type:complete len:442 (+) Transcript_47035:42-1367(+)